MKGKGYDMGVSMGSGRVSVLFSFQPSRRGEALSMRGLR
jgi:hypothetical protein